MYPCLCVVRDGGLMKQCISAEQVRGLITWCVCVMRDKGLRMQNVYVER